MSAFYPECAAHQGCPIQLRLGGIVTADDPRDLTCRFRLHPRDHMGVLLQGERWALVPESLADHLRRDSWLHCDRGVRVS